MSNRYLWKIIVDTGEKKFLYAVGTTSQLSRPLKSLNKKAASIGWRVFLLKEDY